MRLILVIITFGLSLNLQATTYVGEQATLESIYEAKARAVLNTILRPKDYSILISAKINEDDTELEQFREDLEMRFLPGLPIEEQNDLSPAANDLHALKESIDINVIVNKEVDPNKHELIKKLLVSKLHLDLNDGDTINIIKTVMPSSIVDKKPEVKPEVKKEKVIPKSNKLFYFSLAFLAFIAFVLWLFKFNRKKNDKVMPSIYPGVSSDELSPQNKNISGDMSYSMKEERFDVETLKDKEELQKQIKEEERLQLLRNDFIQYIKEESLVLMSEYPNLCVEAISEMIRDERSDTVITFFELLGWDDSRRLMSNLPIKQWGTLGSVLKLRKGLPNEKQYEEALEQCHRELVSKVISHGLNEDKDNPFSFIFTLPYSEKKQIYENEDVSNVAIICLFSNGADLQEIFNFFTAERKRDVILKIAEFQNLSDLEIKILRNQLLERLNNIKTRGGIMANGLEVAAKVLRSLPPAKEEEIYNYIQVTDEKMAAQINNYNLQFSSILSIPSKYQESIYELMDSEEIAKMLFGSNDLIQRFVLNLLPHNKARMVSSDLESHISPSKDETARLRRKVATQIESIIEESGEELMAVLQSNEQEAA